MDYINDFPDIINEFYTDATETSSGEYLGFLINGGWNNEDETAVYISEYDYLNNVEIRVYFSYEEMLQYFLMYYFKNIHCYPDMIAFIEQEFVNYTNYIGESKKYKIDLDVKSIFVRDKLRDFLLKYNYESNKYNLGIINFNNMIPVINNDICRNKLDLEMLSKSLNTDDIKYFRLLKN